MRALVNIGVDELAVQFDFGRDDKDTYHKNHTIRPADAIRQPK
jgi:hypothetical protein